MPQITVNWEELNNKSETMKRYASELKDILTDIHREGTSLNEKWKSNASTQMLEKIAALTKTAENFETVVTSYGDFLSKAHRTYFDTEREVAEEANKQDFN